MKSEEDRDGRERTRADPIRAALRDARVQLSVLNHHIGGGVDVRDTDFDCLDLISIHGPLSPGALAKLAGVRPATMTGILDRLEGGGWIVRERDATDRRAVVVRVLPDRNSEVFALYDGMNLQLDRICAGYDDEQLAVILSFLRQVDEAAAQETAAIAAAPTR